MWLENLIFGTSLKSRPYPSTIKCQKPHCTSTCQTACYAHILSEHKLSKITLTKLKFPDELRISLWYRIINRPKIVTYGVRVMGSDRCVVEAILECCENEREVYEVYKCIVDIFGSDKDDSKDNKKNNANSNDKKNSDEENSDEENHIKNGDLKNNDNNNDAKKNDNNNDNNSNDEKNSEKAENNSDIKNNGNESENKNAENEQSKNTTNSNTEHINKKEENDNKDKINTDQKNKSDLKNTEDNTVQKKNTNNNEENTNSGSESPGNSPSESDDIYDVNPVLASSHQNTLSTATTNNLYTSTTVNTDLIHLINCILSLPSCTKDLGYSVLYTMFDRLQFDQIYFSPQSYNTMPYPDMRTKLTQLIKSNNIYYFLDKVFIYGPKSAPEILFKAKDCTEREIDKVCRNLKVKDVIPVVPYTKGEEYFDFLVVQNEVAKAQECVKKQLVTKIEELCGKNKELELMNINLKKNVDGLEESLRSYESQYVMEMKAMMESVRGQNEHLQKENEALKKNAEK